MLCAVLAMCTVDICLSILDQMLLSLIRLCRDMSANFVSMPHCHLHVKRRMQFRVFVYIAYAQFSCVNLCKPF